MRPNPPDPAVVEAEPEFDTLKELLLELALARTDRAAMARVLEALAARPHVRGAAIWLCSPAEPAAPMTLSMVLGEFVDGPTRWRHSAGTFAEIPSDEPLLGSVLAAREARMVPDRTAWERPEWALREGLEGYHGTPILHQDTPLGVLAVFFHQSVRRAASEGRIWLRIFADHLAAAIANTRAFEEIERLRRRLEAENVYLREEVREARRVGEVVGRSEALRRVLGQVDLVGPTQANVLILGESGTGKELIARAIHEVSGRASGPLITVNCASIPKDLFESEFFGHVRGAFTGAYKDRAGRFQLADGGTLLLDEIGEVPIELQSKLLRVLQEGTFERVGEERTRRVDVRVVAATNRDLRAEVAAGRFRQDLYFRLSVFPVEIPPLRERIEDVPLLAEHFLRQTAQRVGIPAPVLKRRHVMELQNYDWPGNVRELQNVLERAVILARDTGALRFDFLQAAALPPVPTQAVALAPAALPSADDVWTEEDFRRMQRDNIVRALRRAQGRIQGAGSAADLLGIPANTLRSRMNVYAISVDEALRVQQTPAPGDSQAPFSPAS